MDMPALTEKPEAATVARPLSTEPSLLKMAALDAGVPLREVQVAARHADPEPPLCMTGDAKTSIATPPT
jgi:hypothetical protein